MRDTRTPSSSLVAASSLKGIINTNEDPLRCHNCPQSLPNKCIISICCGKAVCKQCSEDGAIFDKNADQCLLCNARGIGRIGLKKKQAKRGHAWAQYQLGWCYGVGHGVSTSDFEAVRWYRKAASQGHISALLHLSHHLRRGEGCTRDLLGATVCTEKALKICHQMSVDGARLVDVGRELSLLGRYEEAIDVLLPLAESGTSQAFEALADTYHDSKKYNEALKWYRGDFMQGRIEAACDAMDCCWLLDRFAEAKFWMTVATRTKAKPGDVYDGDAFIDNIPNVQSSLQVLRQSCKVCCVPLDRSNRKLCKGCKTYCYCSRDCQKVHWNRSEDGHREECKRVTEIKKEIATTK